METWRRRSPWDLVTTTAIWGAEIAFIIPMGTSLLTLQTVMPPDRLERFSRWAADVILRIPRLKWRAVVHPDVDPDTPYIFCQNHVNHFDFCVLYNATPHFKQGLELDEHFGWPVYGWFMKQRGTIPVRKHTTGQLSRIREDFQGEIRAGHSIIAFPEGGRTTDCRVGPFRKGVFIIARDLGVPIVPVAVTGMQDVMRKGSLLVRPGREVTVYCEKPVPTAGIADEEIPTLVQRVRAPIVRRVDDYLAGREG